MRPIILSLLLFLPCVCLGATIKWEACCLLDIGSENSGQVIAVKKVGEPWSDIESGKKPTAHGRYFKIYKFKRATKIDPSKWTLKKGKLVQK
jgi:hypothetical protein